MTLYLKKHCPQYQCKEDSITVIGSGSSVEQCIKIMRAHLRDWNQKIVDLSEMTDVPDCINRLAREAIKRNSDLDITINEDGIVYIDGIGPEMDYYTIRA